MNKPSQGDTRIHVICVHGTFASRDSSDGDAWWQTRGAIANCLTHESRVPGSNGLAEHYRYAEPHHWSGATVLSARREAAEALLDRLTDLEKNGTKYALVGHSHGGSVIWAVLRYAAWKRGVFLSQLVCWITVGTPFIQLRRTKVARILTLVVQGAAILVTVIAVLLVLNRFEWLPARVESVLKNMHPSANSLLHDLASPTSFTAIVLIVMLSLLYLVSKLRQFAPDPGATITPREKREIYEYLALWFGIWSNSDEAIRGLESARMLKKKIVPRRKWFRSRASDRLIWIRDIVGLPITMLDHLIKPLADRFIIRGIRSAALGIDCSGLECVRVAFWPSSVLDGRQIQPIPNNVEELMSERANVGLKLNLAPVRTALVDLSLGLDISGSFDPGTLNLNPSALFHTSYFSEPYVVEFIARRLADAAGIEQEHPAISLNYLSTFQRELSAATKGHRDESATASS